MKRVCIYCRTITDEENHYCEKCGSSKLEDHIVPEPKREILMHPHKHMRPEFQSCYTVLATSFSTASPQSTETVAETVAEKSKKIVKDL